MHGWISIFVLSVLGAGLSQSAYPAPLVSSSQPAATTHPAPITHDIELEKLIVVEPTQGRPRFLRSGETFYFMFRLDKLDVPKIDVSLVNSLCETQRSALTAEAPPTAMQGSHWVMVLKVPPQTPSGVYDILIDLGTGYQRLPRAVRVIDRIKNRFRFVHLSNMNIGDPTAPEFDPRLIEEINLLNPEFIIATGDYLENASAKIDPDSWRIIKRYFRRFNAPCFLLCGDQDDAASFSIQVAPSPVGTFDYGPYHFFFMMDTNLQPIETDTLQIKTLLSDLNSARDSAATFLVSNRDNLGVLAGLKAAGREPAEVFSNAHVRYLVCGGSTDWDGAEYIGKIAAAKLSNFTYVRTGQSSTCLKNGGAGVSRYRVFDVAEDTVRYGYAPSPSQVPVSVPAGNLRIFYHGPNDGSQNLERIGVLNNLPQSYPDCRVVFHLAGDDPQSVSVVNGRLERAYADGRGGLVVLAKVDLPARSAVQVVATVNPEPAQKFAPLPVTIALTSPGNLNFKTATTPAGLKFWSARETLEFTVTNTSREPIKFKPQVALAGEALIVRPVFESASTRPADQESGAVEEGEENGELVLAPQKPFKLRVTAAVRSVTAGKNILQVYALNDPLLRVQVFPVQVSIVGE